jgi:hypothetical protein
LPKPQPQTTELLYPKDTWNMWLLPTQLRPA